MKYARQSLQSADRRRRTLQVVGAGVACIFGGEALCLLGPSAYERQVHLLCHVILYSGMGLVITGAALHWMSVRPRPSRSSSPLSTRYTLAIFFAIAYAWAWLVFVPMVVFRAPLPWTIAATFGPSVAALITHRVTTGSWRAFRVATTWRRTVAATATGIALMVLAYVVLPGVLTADPRRLHWSILTSLGVYNYSTLLGGPLGEEPGWRGYALPRLEHAIGPVRASLVLGLLWTGWHLPLFFYPGWTSSPLWVYVLFLTGQSLILTYGTNLAGFGIITPIAMHATFNTVSRFLSGLFADTQPSARVPFVLVMALCGLATGVALVVATRGRLAYREDSAHSG